MNYLLNKNRIYLIFLTKIFIGSLSSQTQDDLKQFLDTYDKIKTDQEVNEIVKKGIDSENTKNEGPVKLLIKPGDISKYYNEKLNSIKSDLKDLNDVLNYTDSVPPLKSFGYNFFSKRDSVNYIDNDLVTDDYILGFGDEIIFSVWGQVQQYERKIIERDGTVYIDNVGLLYLGGKKLSNAKNYAFDRFSKVYSTLKSKPQLSYFNMSLGTLKRINVIIAGHAQFPGNYVVNPSISIINLLIKAGGVSSTGTLRKILINRNNTYVDSIDLYPLLSGNGYIRDLNLKNNDVVVIPPKGSSISITGAIRNPGYYEIKNDNVNSLIDYAGSFEKDAGSTIYIYNKANSNKVIYDNDFASIFPANEDSIVVPFLNYETKYLNISIDNKPLIKIPWVENLSYELIFSIAGVNVENIEQIELVRRISDDNFEIYILQNYESGSFSFLPQDHITINLIKSNNRLSTVIVKGSVNSPGEYALTSGNESLLSVIKRSGGLKASANISSVEVIRDSVKLGSFDGSIILSHGDTVFARPYNDIVKVEGEVHNPISMQWFKERTIKDYIDLAGGLTANGDKKHIVYIYSYGEAVRVRRNSRLKVQPNSKIIISKKKSEINNQNITLLQQASSVITSLITLAILANSTSN